LLVFLVGTRAQAQEVDRAAQARQHYEAGVSLFEAGNKEQALVEFQLANELSPKKENLFMVAQCQYHLGLLKEARANYQQFLAQTPSGELADIARMRVDAINRRPGVVVINTVPDQVQVRIEGEGQIFTGDAPNEFRVPRGHYRITVAKPNFVGQDRDIAIDVAETKPLFFKLDPIPARLEIHTVPRNATLYVRGNRTLNPYAQDVEPGNYEVYAEARDYLPRHDTVSLTPGQKLKLDFPLVYVQRSGRPELIGFWIGIGAVGGGMFVLTRLDPGKPANLSLVGAGALAGGIGAGVISAALVPGYTSLVPETGSYRTRGQHQRIVERHLTLLAGHCLDGNRAQLAPTEHDQLPLGSVHEQVKGVVAEHGGQHAIAGRGRAAALDVAQDGGARL
jgi:hypothetical protein